MIPTSNIYAALGEGVNVIDSSVTWKGKCPYAIGDSGNVLHGMGMETGIGLDNLMLGAGFFICDQLERSRGSKCALASR